MYTSGWPKNQNKCWKRIGSPPPAAIKKHVFTLRSVKSMVIAPASTGNDRTRRIAVITTDHENNGFLSIKWDGFVILFKVEIKFKEAIIDLTPAKCNEKIVISIDGVGVDERGGYSVHPVPDPSSTNPLLSIR